MARALGAVLALWLAILPVAGVAQDRAQTIADIRAELALLRGDIDGLRA